MRISDCSSDVCSSDLASAGCAGEDGTAGEVAEGTAASPVAGGGAAGTSDIMPRSCWTRPGCEVRGKCQAMNRVMRTEERCVGTACVSNCQCRRSPKQ